MGMILGRLFCFGVLLLAAASAWAQNPSANEFLKQHPPDPDGYIRIEGDILIWADALFNQPQVNGLMATSFLECGCGFWGNGDVPYEFDDNVTAENRERMIAAMQVWENVANVHFREKNGGDIIFTHIASSTEVNESTVGKIDIPFVNQIKIMNWDQRFIIAHELGHCLGFWHEQSRSDRDTYIQINWDNVEEGKGDNFNRHDQSEIYGPYDFDSVMHYSRCAFSSCASGTCWTNDACHTITVLAPYNAQWQSRIGQRNHLSYMDALTMSFLYPQPDWAFLDNSQNSNNAGTFFEPFLTFPTAAMYTPANGTLWIQPGTYSAAGLYGRPMTIKAPLTTITLR